MKLSEGPDEEVLGMLRSVARTDVNEIVIEVVQLDGAHKDVKIGSEDEEGLEFLQIVQDMVDSNYGRLAIIVRENNGVMIRRIDQEKWQAAGFDHANGLGLVNHVLVQNFTPQQWLWFSEARRFSLIESARSLLQQKAAERAKAEQASTSEPLPVVRDDTDIGDATQ